MSIDLSVVVVTLNEEHNIGSCLSQLPKEAEIIVLDSGSEDRTCEIAKSYGAKVHYKKFDNYADQKNSALAMATKRWVLSIDADEVLDGPLQKEILRVVSSSLDDRYVAYELKRRLVFMGRVMKYGKTSDYCVRLFKRGTGEFDGSIHEKFAISEGKIGRLKRGSIFHYSFRDLSDYFTRFNRYTTAIAERHKKKGIKSNLFSHVFRPWFEFIERYFLRLGFLDGYEGYTYALISSLYTYAKYAKLRELEKL